MAPRWFRRRRSTRPRMRPRPSMATDFAQMAAHVEKASTELEQAVAEFSALERFTTVESYLMGYIRAGLAVCSSARDVIAQTQAAREQVSTDPKGAKG